MADPVDPLTITDYVTSPYPSYVSLQSALRLHGMIMQIPAVIYVVSLARSNRVKTACGVYSIHHVAPEFFDGYDLLESGMKLVTPERRWWTSSISPERAPGSLPRCRSWSCPGPSGARSRARGACRIPALRLRTLVNQRLDQVFARRRYLAAMQISLD
jgi:hypothetical protein